MIPMNIYIYQLCSNINSSLKDSSNQTTDQTLKLTSDYNGNAKYMGY